MCVFFVFFCFSPRLCGRSVFSISILGLRCGRRHSLGGVEWSGRKFRDIGLKYMSYMSIATRYRCTVMVSSSIATSKATSK